MSAPVVPLGFLFIARLRLTPRLLVVEVLRKRYSTDFVKNVINMKKIDYIYKLVSTAMSFQSFFNLIWQIETYDHLRVTIHARKDC